jgi:multidrug efflux pump subunit AcrA (membrane-fusion protein)
MSMRRTISWLAVLAVAGGLTFAAWHTRATWRPWLDSLRSPPADAPKEEAHAHGHGDRIKLSEQARKNLKLIVKPVTLTKVYWRTMQIPGVIIDRPGQSDRGITAPVTGVVSKIYAFPGDTRRAGDPLFDLRITSEFVHSTQAELFKAAKEVDFQDKIVKKLENATNVVPEARLAEARNQLTKAQAQAQSYRQILQSLGLTPAQIEDAAKGSPSREIIVVAPPAKEGGLLPPVSTSNTTDGIAYEVKHLKAQLGEQVQAGQVLGTLANHRLLFVEGQAFKSESAALASAAENGWPLEAEFTEDDATAWPVWKQTLTIRHLANAMDPVSRTFAFYIPLTNQSRAFQRDGKTFLIWRFRPGQRVRLHVPVEEIKGDPIPDRPGEFTGVLVLPAAAVVREGAEAYIFRANGDAFDRKPVHVLYEDRRHVVLANDGSVAPGLYVAHNAASALQRALKAEQAGEAGHSHDHHH